MRRCWIGLSGYSYKPWQGEGRFYPVELKAREFFAYYRDRYCAVEMDGTWYKMPSEDMVAKWISESPAEFRYSPKMHRNVTHVARLKETGDDSAKFFVKRLLPALNADRLGPILVQLPPNLKAFPDRLERFCGMLPKSTKEYEGVDFDKPIAYAFEFRNETWFTDEIEGILSSHRMDWVTSDTDEQEGIRRTPGDQAYVRLRKTDYSDEELVEWSKYFASLLEGGKELYIYCKHEDDGAPWIWANRLRDLLKV